MIKISVEQAVKDIRREFRDLTNQEFNTGVARAINHTLGKAKTASSKEIRATYNMSAKDVNQTFSLKRAWAKNLEGAVVSQGKPVPLMKFKPSQSTEGVSVLIRKGSKQMVKGAFIATMASGHVGVFARGTYKGGGGDFNFRHKRIRKVQGYTKVGGRWQPIQNDLSVNELTTVSVPKALSNRVVVDALARTIEESFPARMVHELSRMR